MDEFQFDENEHFFNLSFSNQDLLIDKANHASNMMAVVYEGFLPEMEKQGNDLKVSLCLEGLIDPKMENWLEEYKDFYDHTN